MPIETFTFNEPINVSLQIGDYVYFTNPRKNKQDSFFAGTNAPFYDAPSGGPNLNIPDIANKPILLGTVHSIDRLTGEIEVIVPSGYNSWPTQPTTSDPAANTIGSYFLFSKDKRANTSGIIGYYSETELRNYTTKKAEIFTLNLDFVESSK